MRLERAAPVPAAPLVSVELPEPRPGPSEISVAVEACGVCRTDLHIVAGEVGARLPIVPGHQVVGRVVDRGAEVRELERGERVGVGWVFSTCGVCGFCRSERENLCREALFTGRERDGGYAERIVVPAAAVFRLPDALSPERAAPLLCAGVIGYRTLRVSGIQPGGRLGIFGFGASAHLVLQVARYEGCEVYVFTRRPAHRELALEMGAAWVGGTADDPGVRMDAAASFAPAGEIVPFALDRVDRGGTVVMNAIHASPIPSFEYAKLYGERVVRSVMNFTRHDAEEFLELAAKVPVHALTETFPLEDANRALAAVEREEVRGAAVLLVRP